MEGVETLPVLALDVIRPFSSRDELVFRLHEETREGLQECFNLSKGLRGLFAKLVESDGGS